LNAHFIDNHVHCERHPVVVAHRGASRDAPENTLPAFRLAWEQHADAIECDVHLTQDGQIAVIHDGDTQRVSNTKLVVKQSTLAELRKLDVGVHGGDAFKGSVIPTLAEVFATLPPQKAIFVEIKCGLEIVPALIEEIRVSGLSREQIVIMSFKAAVLQAFKAQAPAFKAYWLVCFGKDDAGETRPPLATVLETLALATADGLCSNVGVPDAVLDAVVAGGYEWSVWAVDDIETARRAVERGATAVITNVPALLIGECL
jgi:glycerophosphoryl diester phosphodiesterase